MYVVTSYAQIIVREVPEVRDTLIVEDTFRYEGQWPEGEGVLYDIDRGMIFGHFSGAVPQGYRYYLKFVQTINSLCFMGYTIAVITRKYAKKILECKDANAVIPVDKCTYDKGVLQNPLDEIYAVLSETFPPLNGPEAVSYDRADECVEYNFLHNAIYIGYVGSQYDELNRALGPLLQKYDCVIYNCDWGTISLPEHSIKVRLFRLKYRLKTNKWAIALRDALLLFLMSEVGFLLIRSASSHIESPLIDLSSVSSVAVTIGAALLASVRIWVEVIQHFKSR